MPTHRGRKVPHERGRLKIMMAGMFGRRTGAAREGGRPRIRDNSIGLLAGTGLIGSGIPSAPAPPWR